MVKLNQDTKDLSTEPLTFTNKLEVNLSPSPPLLVPCERIVHREVPECRKIPILKPQTLIPTERKEWSNSDRLDNIYSVDSDPEQDDDFLIHDDQFHSDFYENKESSANIFDSSLITDISLSNDSFQNHYEDSFDFDWSESDCSFRPLLPESETLPCVTTGKEERDQIDGIEFVSFETERDMVEFTKVELDFKGVAAASQSDDGLEMLDDGSFSDFNSSHTIIPTKTKDITKIKGWMNKRFAVMRNSDDDSRTSQKSDDGYDDGFESSCMRNAEEASSEDRESTKMSDKFETLLDPSDNAPNLVETKPSSPGETCTTKNVTQNTITINLEKLDTSNNDNKGEHFVNIKDFSIPLIKTDAKKIKMIETSLHSAITNSGTNSIYKRRVSQSLIDTISNKIKYNCSDEEQSSPKRTFSDAFNSEQESCTSKKPTTSINKPVIDNLIFSKGIEQSSSDSKSAFVSDALEDFLKNQSKLNIHYELPKLKAAENITHSEEVFMPIKPNPITSRPRVITKPVHFNGYKPKTLAEKRRLLEKGEYRNLMGESSNSCPEATTSNNTNIVTKKKRPRYEMMKLNNVIKKSFIEDKEILQPTIIYKTRSKNVARVCDSGRFRSCRRGLGGNLDKLVSPSAYSNLETEKKVCKKKIEQTSKNKYHDFQKKYKKPYFGSCGELKNCSPVALRRRLSPSLYTALESCDEEVKIYNANIFSPSDLKNKVGMILHVGLGRPLYEEAVHNLELLRGENAEISENFAILAASAVLPNNDLAAIKGTKVLVPVVCKKLIDLMGQTKPKSNNTTQKTNNVTSQKSNSSSKRNQQSKATPAAKCVKESASEIREMMNDMLQYISNKDLFAKHEYSFDPDVPVREDSDKGTKTVSEEDKNLKSNKQKEKSKLNAQLKKIGVTFIDITEETKHEECCEDGPGEDKTCSKDVCKLGCVCDSLKVKDRKQDHCQRVVCMFRCKCPKSMLVKGMSSKGVVEVKSRLWLSANVMHIQHEHKLNLAKEEREYHQTVIRDKDKVIMMTSSKKRAIKLPVKYRDSQVFLDKDFSIEQLEKAFNFSTSTDSNTSKNNKKIFLEEQKKKGVNKKAVTDTVQDQTCLKEFPYIKPCSVVLDKDGISRYKGKPYNNDTLLNLKNKRHRRNVAVKRTAALTISDFKNKECSSKVTSPSPTDSAVIFVEDSSDDEQNEQRLGKIGEVFSLENHPFSVFDSKSTKPLTQFADKIENHKKNSRKNESTAPLPKILAPSRYLVIELVDNVFTVLRYKKYGVVVSYQNLKEAVHQAESSNKTIRIIFPSLKNICNSGDENTRYGAYAVPGFKTNMIFFGPYELDEDHGLVGFKIIGKNVIPIPFIKKDASESKECRIRYLWWEKKFQTSVIKPNKKVTNIQKPLKKFDTKEVIDIEDEPIVGDSESVLSGSKEKVEKIFVQKKGKNIIKRKRRRKTKVKKKVEKSETEQLLVDNTPIIENRSSVQNKSLIENISIADQPLNGSISVANQSSNEESIKSKAGPLIRVRSDLMAVTPPKEEQSVKKSIETVEVIKDSGTKIVEVIKDSDTSEFLKRIRPGRKKTINPKKPNKRSNNDSVLMEAVETVSKKSRRALDEISGQSCNDSIANEESDCDLDVFLFQPIGAVRDVDLDKGRRTKKKIDLLYDMDEALLIDPLEPDATGPLPEVVLMCLTPGIGYIKVVSMDYRISIRHPESNKKVNFFGILAASRFMNKLFKKKMTFEPSDLELKWVLVTDPIIKRLRPFDPDILCNKNLIVTPEGVLEKHALALSLEKAVRERERRKRLLIRAKNLGGLFVDDDKLARMSLKGILETAVRIIQKVNEISISYVDTLNREKAKKARLEARVKVLKAEKCLYFYKQKVKAAKKKEERLQKRINVTAKQGENISGDSFILTSDKEDDGSIQVCSSPEIPLSPVDQRQQKRKQKVIEITVSSDDEDSKDSCIDVSDSDSVEITCVSNQETETRTSPVHSETSITLCTTPARSSPVNSGTKSPTASSPSLQHPEMDTSSNVLPAPVRTVNQVAVEQPKPSWYIAPEEPPPLQVSSVASFISQEGNNFNTVNLNQFTNLPINKIRVTGKTVLVRQSLQGVQLTRPRPVRILPKLLPKVLPSDPRLSPLVPPQSILCKTKPDPVTLNKSPTARVVGSVSVDRRTNKAVAIIDCENPVPFNTSAVLPTSLKEHTKSTHIFFTSSGSSILKNNIQEKHNLQKPLDPNGFIKINEPFRVAPSSTSETSDGSSSDDNDSSDSLSKNIANNFKEKLSNLCSDIETEITNLPSSSSREETVSGKSSESTSTENTLPKERDQQIVDSVFLKGPKLRYPKIQNSPPKGVKVLRPVEKH